MAQDVSPPVSPSLTSSPRVHQAITGVIPPQLSEGMIREAWPTVLGINAGLALLAACSDPVRIVVRCSIAEIAEHPAVLIALRDNGPGLNAEQRQRIFDPFFTTKTKGTGLSMAIAGRIVDAHGGRIAVGVDTVGGAEIRVLLPRGSR